MVHSLSVILPTYCEAGNIDLLIKALLQYLQPLKLNLEIIVVDDNSPDGTAIKVKQLIKDNFPVRLFIRTKERGLATAIKLGINRSSGDILVLMDSDFNHQPQDVAKLLQPLLQSQADLVIGSRYIKGGGMHVTEANFLQFFFSKLGNFFINRVLFRLPVHESLSGFVAFKRTLIKSLNQPLIFQGYGDYCLRLLYSVYRQGFIIKEVSVVYGRRRWGKSKTRLFKIFVDYLITSLQLRYQWS